MKKNFFYDDAKIEKKKKTNKQNKQKKQKKMVDKNCSRKKKIGKFIQLLFQTSFKDL